MQIATVICLVVKLEEFLKSLYHPQDFQNVWRLRNTSVRRWGFIKHRACRWPELSAPA